MRAALLGGRLDLWSKLERGDIDAVAEDVVFLDYDVALVNADAKRDALVVRDRGVALGHPALHDNRAGEGMFGDNVRLCILTGQRRSEIAQLTADMIEGDCVRFPPALTKNRREHMGREVGPAGCMTKWSPGLRHA